VLVTKSPGGVEFGQIRSFYSEGSEKLRSEKLINRAIFWSDIENSLKTPA